MSHSLIPPSLNESELAEALDNLVNSVTAGGAVKVHLDLKAFNEDETVDKLKLTIYRIVQEQFNNILKHAKAANIYVTLGYENDNLLLTIRMMGKDLTA